MKYLNNKGIGIEQVIIMTAVLIFILLPIFTVIFEKAYVRIVIHNYEEICDMAVYSAVSQLHTKNLSEGIVAIEDINNVKNQVYNCVKEFDNNTFTIKDFTIEFYDQLTSCPYGFSSNYHFFHIEMKVDFKRIANSNDNLQITIHMDIELPIDR